MTQMDWPGLLRAGLHRLHLTPDVFWRLTPAELQTMLGLSEQGGPMSRAHLNRLLDDFPDLITKDPT